MDLFRPVAGQLYFARQDFKPVECIGQYASTDVAGRVLSCDMSPSNFGIIFTVLHVHRDM